MKRTTIFAAILGLTFTLASCEGNTDRIRQIRNNTSGSINVIADGTTVSNYNESISVGQTEILFIESQLGGSDYIETPSAGIISMIITNTSGDTCLKDFIPQNNWEIIVEERKKVPSDWRHEYTFIVDDSDF